MKPSVTVLKWLCAVCVILLAQSPYISQGGASEQPTKTIVGDLLMIDRDLYIVRGDRGEIQIEATSKTEITEDFKFGDRIKAVVLMNNKALKIERAGANDLDGHLSPGMFLLRQVDDAHAAFAQHANDTVSSDALGGNVNSMIRAGIQARESRFFHE